MIEGEATAWSRERIEEMLRRESFSYQRIELPHGLATPGQDRRWTADRIFPADLAGKSVLDLGCNHGYFCFEALRRGAGRVVGVDYSPQIIRRARLLAEAKGAKVEFQQRDLNAEPVREAFDYVLCLNLLHHLDDPLAQLQSLTDVAQERLVLEMAGLSLLDYIRRLKSVPLLAFFLSSAPVIYIASQEKGKTGQERLKYYLTKRATRLLLERQPKRFASVEMFNSEFKGRYIVLAKKHG